MVYEEREREEEFVVRVSRSTYHVAKKEHKCYSCLEPIPVGTTYRYTVIIQNAGLTAMHEHSGCQYWHGG